MNFDTNINPLKQQDGNETPSATATDRTDQQRPEVAPPEELPISIDSIFDVLQNERRRRVLRYLAEQGGPVTVSDLSEYIAALENDKPIAELTSQERKRVYVGLYQSHLPKMDDVGFIQYNQPRGTVELGPHAVYAERYLQQDESVTHPWPTYYLGLVGVGWLVVLGSLVVEPLGTTIAIGVFLALTTTLALAHAYSSLQEPEPQSFETPP